MASNVKQQERRRRIVERGSDRMALITGQVRTLNDSSSLSSPTETSTQRPHHHAHTESSPSILFSPDDQSQINPAPEVANEASFSKLVKLRTMNECSSGNRAFDISSGTRAFDMSSRTRAFDIGKQIEPQLNKVETVPEIIKTPVIDTITRTSTQPPKATPSIPKPQTQSCFFSSKRVNSCIMASENMRAISSLIIAILVVMSNIGYPIFGFDFLSWVHFIVSRPFFLILLTDVTIVLCRMVCEPANFVVEETEEERKDEGDNWDGAVKFLERAH
ncbi:hypothetical protein JCGZ_06264 [Jatropha curcas]|uniref:Uncharacterized protein n=1 Tax=Jatropha curcas TaxID=180498 RepID=A0A067KQI2_JATCU|nr:hypothetical protein JCGZ_06264 [Jatropha curcas]